MANNFDFNGKLFINSSGNILIGTTTDSGFKLDVNGTGRFTSHVTATLISANNGDGFRVFASTATAGGSQPGIGYYTVGGSKRFTNQLDVSGDTWGVVGTTGTNYLLIAQSGAATFSSSVTIQSGNSLFVNNANNTRSGFLRTSSEGTELSSFAGAGEPLILIAPDTTAAMRFYTGGSTSANERMRITSSGRLLVNTTTDLGSPYSVQVNGRIVQYGLEFAFVGDEDKRITVFANRALTFATNDVEKMRITSGGNVLIGTTTDIGTKLSVNGVVNASDYYFNGTSSERVVKRFVAGVTVAANGYTLICNVTGDSLASAIRLTIQGTSDNVVINVLADIQVNHNGRILINASSGFYTQINLRVISDGNANFSIEIEPVVAINATGCNIEVYPLNSESVVFSGSPQTASSLTMTTRGGNFTLGLGGNNGNISAGGALLVSGNAGIGTTNLGTYRFSVAGGQFGTILTGGDLGTGSDVVRMNKIDNSIAMLVRGDGNVGIGNTAPGSLLQVGNAGAAPTGLATLTLTGANTAPQIATKPGLYHRHAVGLGVFSDFEMSFQVNGSSALSDAMYITNGGNVLIGTTTDSGFKLDVSGPSRINLGSDGGILYAQGASSNLIQLGTDGAGAYIEATGASSGRRILRMQVFNGTNDYAQFFIDGANNYIYTSSNINFGIGTATPQTKLQVVGAAVQGEGLLNISNTFASGGVYFPAAKIKNTRGNHSFGIVAEFSMGADAGADRPSILLYADASAHSWNLGQVTTGTGLVDSFAIGYRANNLPSTFNTFATNYFQISPAGNVQIGTTTDSGYRLRVAGGSVLVDYTHGLYATNSVANIALLARVSNTSGIVNFAEYAAAANINGYVIGSTAAQVKGVFADNKIEFFTSAAVKATLDSSGNFGIGTVASAGIKLHVLGDTLMQNGSLGVGVDPNATDGRIDASNDIVAFSTSDSRLKENITPIPFALEKVKALTGVMFDWKEDTKAAHGHSGRDTGIIAQEVQAVMPTAVRTNDTGYLAVRYEKLIGLLIEANKELAERVEQLEKLIK